MVKLKRFEEAEKVLLKFLLRQNCARGGKISKFQLRLADFLVQAFQTI